MQQWPKRIRNLVLLSVLLASIIGVASVLTAPWAEEGVSKLGNSPETSQLSEAQRAQRPVDVF